jgi:DndB-like DNA-sulfur modification-associated protein
MHPRERRFRLAQGRTRSYLSPDHAGFTPETYDLILEITLLDAIGEGQAHYEYNELITKSSATRRNYLEAGQTQNENWVVHELRKQDPVLLELIEKYEKSISKNSPKLVTFSTMSQGVQEGWGDLIGDMTKGSIAKQIVSGLKMLREEIPEWGPLPFAQRKEEREKKLYSQAIVLRAMLRVLRELHDINVLMKSVGDWDRWRSMIKKLKKEYKFDKDGEVFKGEFLSRENPLFYKLEGQTIYQMNKGGRERKRKQKPARRNIVSIR